MQQHTGAMAVHQFTKTTIINPQKSVAVNSQLLYSLAHSGWMVLSDTEVRLPHNPLVCL